MNYLGLGKTKFFSSVCYISEGERKNMQVWQTERLARKKNSGAWPHLALKSFLQTVKDIPHDLIIAENRDVETPAFFEQYYNEEFPFFDFLKKDGLEKFSSFTNPDLRFVTHHEAHAYAALLMSPFEQSIIVVLDGAGSRAKHFSREIKGVDADSLEECTVYLQDGPKLKEVFKRWIQHDKDKDNRIICNGIGHLYETCSQLIFNDSNSSGKVMGLAPFALGTHFDLQAGLDWEKSFKAKDKRDWENSPHQDYFKNVAASVQHQLEQNYEALISNIKEEFPAYKNLILTGGCALNCTNNALIYYKKIFEKIYVLPFPGDDGIAVGCAGRELYTSHPEKWEPLPSSHQVSFWGPLSSIPDEEKLKKLLEERKIPFEVCSDVTLSAADDLINGKIIGWFQGTSESGPRALGHRSILCRADRSGVKNYLNEKIKRREAFRPYGCSVLQEKAFSYFEVDEHFENPFMSFAVKIKESYRGILHEVSHVDGTSRMQTIRKSQDELFYSLIKEVGDRSGHYCLLNTSLNIMGEPIVETMADAIRFFESTAVDSMYIGKIKLKRTEK